MSCNCHPLTCTPLTVYTLKYPIVAALDNVFCLRFLSMVNIDHHTLIANLSVHLTNEGMFLVPRSPQMKMHLL